MVFAGSYRDKSESAELPINDEVLQSSLLILHSHGHDSTDRHGTVWDITMTKIV